MLNNLLFLSVKRSDVNTQESKTLIAIEFPLINLFLNQFIILLAVVILKHLSNLLLITFLILWLLFLQFFFVLAEDVVDSDLCCFF